MTMSISMKTTLQIKLLPLPEQHRVLEDTMRVFNEACSYIAEVAFENQCASKFKLQTLVYQEVRQRFGLTAQLAIRAIAKVVEAYKRDKSILCQFHERGAVVYDERIMRFKGLEAVNLWTRQGRMDIPMQMGDYQRVQWHRARGQADLVLVNNVFYLLVTIETPEEPPINPQGFIGVDLGIIRIATTSDGDSFCGLPIERTRRRFHKLRQALQKKGTKSAKRHLKRIAKTEARFRKDTNHCIANTLVDNAKDTGRGIGLEDLKHIRRRTTVRRDQRAQHSGWSFYQLQHFIQYKARLRGVPVVIIDPWYTSRECNGCGHADKANRQSQSAFVCVSCGHTDHADVNAAKNIRVRAEVMRPLVACVDPARKRGSTAASQRL